MAPSPTSTDILLEFRKIQKNYGHIEALRDISFQIRKGEVFGLIGPNGAGKTTTIKILVGLIQDYSGEILLDGINLSKQRNEIYRILGYLPQEVGFQEWRTVNQALATFGRLSGIPASEIAARTSDILEQVGLIDMGMRKIAHLSGGMRQKLRLAQALMHKPDLLVLDEPMTGLDPSSRYQMKQIIKSLVAQGITIFLSSHILSDVQNIAHRIGIVNQGRILTVGTPEELQAAFHVGNSIALGVAPNSPLPADLEGIDGVFRVEPNSAHELFIKIAPDVDLDAVISAIINQLQAQRTKVRTFSLLQPSLEEVYLKYVEGGVA